MSIGIIKKIRKFLIVLVTFLLFIGSQVSKNRYGDTATILEAFLMTLIGTGLLFTISSDWLYYNHLIDKGVKINYYFYQLFSLFVAMLMFSIVTIAVYNGF